jgi:hypothetical protein
METFETETSRQTGDRTRAKTSQRMKYEAEIAVLKREMGGLEDLRIKLGLSRRKICQILMVDPSAWTRWTAPDGDAPPHIYQALRWYLDSKGRQTEKLETYWEELKVENRNLHDDLAQMRVQFKRLKVFVTMLMAAAIWLGLVSLYMLIRSRG